MDVRQFRKLSVPLCKSQKKFNKVFGIGANKTGTTTLKAVFEIIGLSVAPQQEGELYGVQWHNGNFGDLKNYIERHDAFQDAPFSWKVVFAQVDVLFPGSKFILTCREPEAWFDSLLNFHRKIMQATGDKPSRSDVERFAYLYPGYLGSRAESEWLLEYGDDLSLSVNWDLLYKKDHYIDLYVQRNKMIARYFSSRPDELLVIDVTRERDTGRIVEFLGLPTSLVTRMPHLNKT